MTGLTQNRRTSVDSGSATKSRSTLQKRKRAIHYRARDQLQNAVARKLIETEATEWNGNDDTDEKKEDLEGSEDSD